MPKSTQPCNASSMLPCSILEILEHMLTIWYLGGSEGAKHSHGVWEQFDDLSEQSDFFNLIAVC